MNKTGYGRRHTGFSTVARLIPLSDGLPDSAPLDVWTSGLPGPSGIFKLLAGQTMVKRTYTGTRFDHLVIGAATCEQGVAWFAGMAGVNLPVGGKHPLMGTHNHLSALSKSSFIEIIATDPDAQAPAIKRWYGLDDPDTRSRLQTSPQLLTWVVATDNIEQSLGAVRSAGINPGQPVTVSRDGMTWRIAVAADGSMPLGGLFPTLIEWPQGVNPVAHMQNQGLILNSLCLACENPAPLQQAIDALDLDRSSVTLTLTEGAASMQATMSRGEQYFSL